MSAPASDLTAPLDRLRALEGEHRFVLRVLAVAVEQLLRATSSEQVHVSAAALSQARTLTAWRDESSADYVFTVAP